MFTDGIKFYVVIKSYEMVYRMFHYTYCGDKISFKSVESSTVPIIRRVFNVNANITATSWEAERFPIEDKRRRIKLIKKFIISSRTESPPSINIIMVSDWARCRLFWAVKRARTFVQ